MFFDNTNEIEEFGNTGFGLDSFGSDPFGSDPFGGNDCTIDQNEFVKRCERCNINLKEEQLLPDQEACVLCGTKLTDLTTKDIKKPVIDEKKSILGDILTIDKYGYMHIINPEEESRYEGRDRLKICINGRVYKSECIQYDEYTIGRNSTTFCPDIDLSKVDFENRISRKHLMIYRQEDKYYVRNLSAKNTVHVNDLLISENESMEINHKDKIILSNFIECEFEIASLEGEII